MIVANACKVKDFGVFVFPHDIPHNRQYFSLFMSMTKEKRLILASGSKYRRELLSRLHIPFDVVAADIDESRNPEEPARILAERLAQEKARAVADLHPGAWIIGSDQTLALNEEILGKPGNHENAVVQLQKLSGQSVLFHTGVCLVTPDHCITEIADIQVKFRSLDTTEIEAYLALEPAYDCAGSCKAEGLGITLVESIQSDDPTALIGLPLIRLRKMLDEAGWSVPR